MSKRRWKVDFSDLKKEEKGWLQEILQNGCQIDVCIFSLTILSLVKKVDCVVVSNLTVRIPLKITLLDLRSALRSEWDLGVSGVKDVYRSFCWDSFFEDGSTWGVCKDLKLRCEEYEVDEEVGPRSTKKNFRFFFGKRSRISGGVCRWSCEYPWKLVINV